jgi:ATP/maltotriose-dependent transcriptional regulator MalT
MPSRRPAPGETTKLRGRRRECAQLDELHSAVRGGECRTLLVSGEAGVGKTALLAYLVESAPDLELVRAVGVESDMELPFAGLHQLCAPMLDRLERLPTPQRGALEVVFGRTAGPPPDRFLVGLAVLSLLSEIAERHPLMCVIDDAQWLDRASAQVLAFVARRLLAEPVGLVFAARKAPDELSGLPELEVRGLRNDDARALLSAGVRVPLDERVRDRIVAETRGNPLALLELPQGLTVTQLAGGFGVLGDGALSGRIEESFLRRLETLAREMRALLLVAAADPVGDPLLLWGAVEELGVALSALDAVETDGLLSIGERVTFRHPLVRSAVYRSASASERRAVHLALAAVTDRVADPDRRAWHLASAAFGPDEEVAVELERSADRAQARGGLAAAAAFLQRAVALTGDPARRADRALAAAELGLQAGALEDALGLLSVAEVGPLNELERARVDLLRAEAAYSHSRGGDAPSLLVRAAKTLEALDARMARDTYLDAWSAALFAGRLAVGEGLHSVSREALAGPPAPTPPRPSDLLLDGFSLACTDGRPAAAPVLRQAATAFAGEEATTEEILRWGWLATAAAVMVWDYDTCLAVAARGVTAARDAGALTVLAVGANVLAQALALGGDFPKAVTVIAEADAVTTATDTQVAPYGALVLAGLQGRDEAASALIHETIAEATAGGQGTAVQYARWAAAILFNGLGRYREALTAAQQASDDTPELFVSVWAASELVEAATRTGEREAAHIALERLDAAAAAAGNDWARGVQARARALLDETDTAERLYREAIERLSRTRLRPEAARAHLVYGEWLRREGRRVQARAELRRAHQMFGTIGMDGFAERARIELLATGATVRKRSAQTIDDLTPQEHQIAGLARDGLSNPEIGARLFLSPRTVEWHLRKVFSKLDIGSRRELADALPDREPVTL